MPGMQVFIKEEEQQQYGNTEKTYDRLIRIWSSG